MKLNAIVEGERALLYMERYVDEGTRTYSPFGAKSEVGQDYQPRSERPFFELVSVFAPKGQVDIFEADPERRIRDFYVRSDEVRFLVHPETWADSKIDHMQELHALPRGEPIEVAPTASTRTVLTARTTGSVPHHFIKLHYPRRISRFNRRLRRKNIRNSVDATRDLEHLRFEKFAYLPDTLGFTFANGCNPWGFLIREEVPRPYHEGRFLIPYFSLYSGDLHHPDDRPLLVQMIDSLGVEPQAFVIDKIMIPVLECWAKVVRERGILLESHAQNILLEIDANFRPCRVVHRDFDVWVDPEARRQRGLAALGAAIGTDAEYPREQHYSLVYDHFIGRELFGYLLGILTRYYKADERAVRSSVAKAFHSNVPDAADLFPATTTYYFSNELLPGNDFELVDTHTAPQ
jgi:hypothetical protein